MAFLLPVLEGLGTGLLGNALGGAIGNGVSGNAENAAMNALNSQDQSFQLGMYASEVQNQEQLQMQSEVFDQMMDERSENMREVDTLRNVDMAQRKMDASRTIATRHALMDVGQRARAARHVLRSGGSPASWCRSTASVRTKRATKNSFGRYSTTPMAGPSDVDLPYKPTGERSVSAIRTPN